MRSAKKASSDLPDTTSTMRPSTSVDTPYSKADPGWWASGTVASFSTKAALSSPRNPTAAAR